MSEKVVSARSFEEREMALTERLERIRAMEEESKNE